jgi:hypothetical protein
MRAYLTPYERTQIMLSPQHDPVVSWNFVNGLQCREMNIFIPFVVSMSRRF